MPDAVPPEERPLTHGHLAELLNVPPTPPRGSPPGRAGCQTAAVSATDPEDPYPEIGNLLAHAAPPGWERIELDVCLWDGAARFQATSYGVGQPPGLRLENASRLRVLFERLRAITRELAKPGTPMWTTAKVVLRSDGEFDVKFGYEAGDEGAAPPSKPPARTPGPPPKRPWWRFWGR